MSIFTIALFFIYIYGLGYSVTRFQLETNAETIAIRLGIGLGAVVVLGYVLNLFRIPLDWRLILLCSVGLPLYDYFKVKQIPSVRSLFVCVKPDKDSVIVGLILLGCAMLYCGGPFCYPWLEDTDSWHHAAAIKYITLTKNLNAKIGLFQYINPYPPGYDWVMALLHQTSESLYWTLKFFNGLIISLGFLFFYYFVKEFSKEKSKARYALYFLACIPCYLSHFIWAHALVVTLFFPAFYLILKSEKEARYILPGGIVVAAIFLTQPTQALKFAFLVLILLCTIWIWGQKKINHIIMILMLAVGIAIILWWGPVIYNLAKGKSSLTVVSQNTITGVTQKKIEDISSLLNTGKGLFGYKGGTATRPYHLEDYLIPNRNIINNSVGIGLFLMILSFFGLLIGWFKLIKEKEKRDKIYYATLLGWLLFAFLGLNSETFHFPFGLFAFRFWMLLAIPVSLLASECLLAIRANNDIWWRRLAVLIACILVFTGSAMEKIDIQTRSWAPGTHWSSIREAEGYVWLRYNLPKNTKVFVFKNNFVVNGVDMLNDYWNVQQGRDFQDIFQRDIVELHRILKKHGYQYLAIGAKEAKYFGGDKVREKVEELKRNPLFEFIYEHKKAVLIFKIV